MIELIHKHPILIKALLTLVTVTFILTGGWMLGRESKVDYAAKVGNEKISVREYDDAYARMQDFYRQMFKGNIPPDLEKKLDIGKKALSSLIDKRLIMMAAEKEDVRVANRDVSDAVTGNKDFQDDQGRFSVERYRAVLKDNGLTTSEFEQATREDLTVQRFEGMVKDSVYVAEAEVRDYYKKQQESQGKEFKEADFQAQKANLSRMVTAMEQEKTMNSFMDELRRSQKVEINPDVFKAAPES